MPRGSPSGSRIVMKGRLILALATIFIILALAGLVNQFATKRPPTPPAAVESPATRAPEPVPAAPTVETPAEPPPAPPRPKLDEPALRSELLAILADSGSQEFDTIFESLYQELSSRNLDFGGLESLRLRADETLQALLNEGVVRKEEGRRYFLAPTATPAPPAVENVAPTPTVEPPATALAPPAPATPEATPPPAPEVSTPGPAQRQAGDGRPPSETEPEIVVAGTPPHLPVYGPPEPAPPLPQEPEPGPEPTPAQPFTFIKPAEDDEGEPMAPSAPTAAESFGLFSGDASPDLPAVSLPGLPESPFVLMEDVANAALPKPPTPEKKPKKGDAAAKPDPTPAPEPESDESDKVAEAARVKALRESPSLFIRLHADLPVRWQVWGPEVIEQARRERKMIYLSVSFASDHWTQLMARESFADSTIAEILNENFVCALADRQQRPDLDNLFLNLMQNLSGDAGWPLHMWLTPDLQPFFGCSYLPLKSSRNGPGFAEVLSGLLETLAGRPTAVEEQARTVDAAMRALQTIKKPAADYDPAAARALFTQAAGAFAQEYDFANGGFGTVPKFPESLAIRMLLRATAATGDPLYRDIATGTLNRLGAGALRDQLGGGFHRYSTAVDWSEPRYEKMLADNVLIVEAALDAFQATQEVRYAALARETLDFIAREMALPGGGFGVSLNSESAFGNKPHVDGGYYTWRAEAIDEALGKEEGAKFRAAYRLPIGGNLPLTEQGVLYLGIPGQFNPPEWDADRRKLLELRAKRDKPLLDTLAVCGLNAHVANAFRRGGLLLDEPRYSELGEETLSWTLRGFARSGAGGGLYRSVWRDQATGNAFLEDYAALAGACLDMAETSFDQVWMAQALKLAQEIQRRFYSEDLGVFYQTEQPVNDLPVRPLDFQDAATASGASLATTLFARLGLVLENAAFRKVAATSFATMAAQLGESASAAPSLLRAEPLLAPNAPLLIVVGRNGDETVEKLLAATQSILLPEVPLLLVEPRSTGPLAPLVQTRLGAEHPLEGMAPTVFVCRDNRVGPPLRTPEEVRDALAKIPAPIQSAHKTP